MINYHFRIETLHQNLKNDSIKNAPFLNPGKFNLSDYKEKKLREREKVQHTRGEPFFKFDLENFAPPELHTIINRANQEHKIISKLLMQWDAFLKANNISLKL